RIVNLLRALNQLGRFFRGVVHRNDLIVLAVQNKRREIKLLQVFREICLGKCLNAFVRVQGASLHAPKPELIQSALRHFRTWPIGSIKLHRKVFVELRPVTGNALANAVEYLDGQAFRVGSSLQHNWRNSSEQNSLSYALASVASNIARDLATACRMSDQCRI